MTLGFVHRYVLVASEPTKLAPPWNAPGLPLLDLLGSLLRACGAVSNGPSRCAAANSRGVLYIVSEEEASHCMKSRRRHAQAVSRRGTSL